MLLATGRKQRYGSALWIDFEREMWIARPIEDEPHVDARRAQLGLPKLADELAARNAILDLRVNPRPPLDVQFQTLINWLDGHDFFRHAAPGTAAAQKAAALKDGTLFAPGVRRHVPFDRASLGDQGAEKLLRDLASFLDHEGVRWKHLEARLDDVAFGVELDGKRHAVWTRSEKQALPSDLVVGLATERTLALVNAALAAAGSVERAWALGDGERTWILFTTPLQRLAIMMSPAAPDPGKFVVPG